MPAATRSSNKKQTTLEDVGAGSKKPSTSGDSHSSKPESPSTSKKRKAEADAKASTSAKSVKKTPPNRHTSDEGEDVITINRAPVLQLWGASVAHLLYPKLSWDACLSIGGAVSTITAISKGRSIGTISKPDPGKAEKKRQRREEGAACEQLDEVDVLGFQLRLDSEGHALVGDQSKKPNEDALRKKYGDDKYDTAKKAFADALTAWKGKEDDLNDQAFLMYEQFRPSIPPGQSGWGRKGQLNLQAVRDVVGEGA